MSPFPRLFRALLALALLPASPVMAETAAPNCEPWTFTTDGGFEGGENVAEVLCEVPGRDGAPGLALTCDWNGGIALRAYLDGLETEPDDAEVTITYQTANGTFPLPTRFEAADGAFASALSGTAADPGLLSALTGDASVSFAVEGIGNPTTVSLTGAREAIAQLQKACAELN